MRRGYAFYGARWRRSFFRGRRTRTGARELTGIQNVSPLVSGIVYRQEPAFEAAPAEGLFAAAGDVFLLPKYTVEDSRVPQLGERSLYSKEDLTKVAMRRYFSPFHGRVLSRYRIGRDDERYAMMKYEADERRQNIAKAALDLELYRVTDEKTAKRVREELYSTFLRQPAIGVSRLPGRW